MDKCTKYNINIPNIFPIDITTFTEIYKLKDHWFSKFEAKVNEKGGKVIDNSRIYIDQLHKIRIECDKGHSWNTCWNTLNAGSWCPTCDDESKRIHTIKEMQDLAIKKNGLCLSDVYINNATNLSWHCKNCGNDWDATPQHILDGSWCRTCFFNSRKYTIENMQDLAKKNNGTCLSDTYIRVGEKLLWECYGCHKKWEALASSIINGHWCGKRKCRLNTLNT